MTALLSFLLLALSPSDCARTPLHKVAGIQAWRINGTRTFYYESGMAVDADGAPKAYHPGDTGMDDLKSAGHRGNWWALLTDTGKSSGTPLLQRPSDPAPGYYVAMTSLEDETKKLRDPHRYVDATKIPYFVLPPTLERKAGARLGDFAVVINRKNGRRAAAIYADMGPDDKLGEGSIALAKLLGIPANPRSGGASSGIVFVVFPKSGNGKPRSAEEIATWGATATIPSGCSAIPALPPR